jgi:PadR family transcriptional regulator, regulatory protein PadR
VTGIERVTRQLVVVLAVLLNAYARGESLHGYAISRMACLSGPSTYRNLDRLEEAGLVDARWEEFPQEDDRPRRRYYRLNDQGADTARQIVAERHPELLEHP